MTPEIAFLELIHAIWPGLLSTIWNIYVVLRIGGLVP
jgi:hypothetical protein